MSDDDRETMAAMHAADMDEVGEYLTVVWDYFVAKHTDQHRSKVMLRFGLALFRHSVISLTVSGNSIKSIRKGLNDLVDMCEEIAKEDVQ